MQHELLSSVSSIIFFREHTNQLESLRHTNQLESLRHNQQDFKMYAAAWACSMDRPDSKLYYICLEMEEDN